MESTKPAAVTAYCELPIKPPRHLGLNQGWRGGLLVEHEVLFLRAGLRGAYTEPARGQEQKIAFCKSRNWTVHYCGLSQTACELIQQHG